MCQKERDACPHTYAWVSVIRKQMSKCDCIQAHTCACACAHTHSSLDPRVNLVTQWYLEPNTKHMSKFGVIITAEWYDIVSFNMMQEEKPNDGKS